VVLKFFQAIKRCNIGMVQCSKHSGLALETSHAVRISGKILGEDFQRYITIQTTVMGTVHLAHPARTNCREDLERPRRWLDWSAIVNLEFGEV
jgi:hypothetical protein